MNIVTTFDPSVVTSDTFTVPSSAANGKMAIWNESSISLQINFQNGDTAYVPAWVAVLYPTPPGNVNVVWSQHTILTSSGPPASKVIVEVYANGEVVPENFPVTLMRQGNVGNSIGTIV